MVDDNMIMAFLEKRKPDHYVVENGFIFIKEDNIRGNEDSMRHLTVQAQLKTNRQPSIEVRQITAGSRNQVEAMEYDERYQIKSTPQDCFEIYQF